MDFVKQAELGLKYRTGTLSLFVTGFYAETEEQNFEATSQLFFDRDYEAKGVEVEAEYLVGNFSVRGSFTWTDAEIVSDALNPDVEGNTPRRQADLIYSLTPQYSIDRLTFGANLLGTTDSYAQDNNELKMPGYAIVNAFVYYDITEGLNLAFNVNNLFDEFAITESEEGSAVAGDVIRARSINGRTMTVSLRYSF